MFEPQLSTKQQYATTNIGSGLGFVVANVEGHVCVIHSGLTWV
jgi:hypothetical protein